MLKMKPARSVVQRHAPSFRVTPGESEISRSSEGYFVGAGADVDAFLRAKGEVIGFDAPEQPCMNEV